MVCKLNPLVDRIYKPSPSLPGRTFQEDLHCVWSLILFNPFLDEDVRSHTCPNHVNRVRDHIRGNPNTRETCYEQHCIVHVLSILVDELLHLDSLVVKDRELGGVSKQISCELTIVRLVIQGGTGGSR